jgi:hypothetical protein
LFVRCERKDGFGVLLVRREAEREAVRKSEFAAIHVWGDVAGVGGGKRSCALTVRTRQVVNPPELRASMRWFMAARISESFCE